MSSTCFTTALPSSVLAPRAYTSQDIQHLLIRSTQRLHMCPQVGAHTLLLDVRERLHTPLRHPIPGAMTRKKSRLFQ